MIENTSEKIRKTMGEVPRVMKFSEGYFTHFVVEDTFTFAKTYEVVYRVVRPTIGVTMGIIQQELRK